MTKPPMSPKRRFLAAMMGGPVDRIPVGNVVSVITVELMAAADAWFPQAHLNADEMARLAVTGHEILGYDTVMPIYSVTQEAAALGCEVDWGYPEMMPGVRTRPFAETDDLRVPQGWIEAPSIRVVLDALGLLRKALGHRVVIVGKVMGPWTLSYHLNGVQQFLMDTILDPDKVRRFLDVLREVSIRFGVAQIREGADLLCLADHATGDLVSPECYRDFLMPVHREMIPELGCPVILHICGDTASRLEYIVAAGFDCFHFESKVDARRAKEIVGQRMSLLGNVNNPDTLLFGSPEDAYREASYAAEAGVEILGPECAIPLRVPNENLKAIVAAAEDYAKGTKGDSKGPG